MPPAWPFPTGQPATAAPPRVMRLPGESVEDYLKRTGTAPPPAGPSATAPLPPPTPTPALAPPIAR